MDEVKSDLFFKMAEKIIAQQEAIIGPIAVDQAKRVKELEIDWKQKQVVIKGNPQKAIDELVEQYKELFGQLAVESCKQAVNKLMNQLSDIEIPSTLR